MATKLKNLHFIKVDAVDEGANQRADIVMRKAKDAEHGNDDPEPEVSLFKRFLAWMKGESISATDIAKEATSFEQQISRDSLEEVSSEIWNVCYALRESLQSILYDTESDSVAKQTAFQESIQQFVGACTGYTPLWSAGKLAGLKKANEEPVDIGMVEKDRGRLDEMIAKNNSRKGEPEEMAKIDKSKMTPEEVAAYDAIIAKYSVEDEEMEDVAKAAETEEKEDENDDDSVAKSSASKDAAEVYKGMINDLRKEIATLKDNALNTELASVAKKYESLGKKQDEMIETLKKAKRAGVYDDVIAAYDAALEAQEASGIFEEIGKSREGGSGNDGGAIAKAKAAVAELRKSNPALTEAQALDQVLLNDPELMKEYDR